MSSWHSSLVREPLAAVAAALTYIALLVYVMFVYYERPVAEAYRQSEWLYAQTTANNEIVAHGGQIRRLHALAVADLRRISTESSLSIGTANVILDLQQSAEQYGITIVSIEPGAENTPAIAAPTAGGPTQISLSRTPFTIRARGTFHTLLRFESALSRQRTLLSVNDSSFELAPKTVKRTSGPLLDVTIHATLYRLTAQQVDMVR